MSTAPRETDLDLARIPLHALPTATAVLRGRALEVAEANGAFLDLVGATSLRAIADRSLYELVDHGDAEHVRSLLPALSTQPQTVDVRLGFSPPRSHRGRLHLAAAGSDDDRTAVVVATVVDLTVELDRLDATTRELLSMDSAARRLSHDLRQPLTVLAGYARILRDGDIDDEERGMVEERSLEAAQRAAEQVAGLTRRPSQEDGGEDVRLADVAAWLEGLTALAFDDRGALLVNDIADEVVPVDDGVLRQVLLNLVNNALEHAGDVRHLRVHVASREVADGLELLVTDTGHGIPDDALEDVFEHGVQLGVRTRRGRGTGLATSRRIVEEVGGWIAAVPHDGGARFVVWLPMVSRGPTTG